MIFVSTPIQPGCQSSTKPTDIHEWAREPHTHSVWPVAFWTSHYGKGNTYSNILHIVCCVLCTFVHCFFLFILLLLLLLSLLLLLLLLSFGIFTFQPNDCAWVCHNMGLAPYFDCSMWLPFHYIWTTCICYTYVYYCFRCPCWQLFVCI